MTNSLDTNTLTQLLAQKCELLVQLRQIVARQTEFINTSDLSQLLNLLAVKQRFIGKLQTIQRQLGPYRGQLPQERQWNSEDDRRRCAELADACQRLLAEVMEIEKHSESQLILRRDEAATRLHAVHFAIQTREAYVGADAPTITQVDLSSE
jgi:flagellar biosynthesis/type III secretory pathway chaperone